MVLFGVISVRKDIIRLMKKFGLNCEEKRAFSLAKGHLNLPQLWKTNPCMLFLDWQTRW